MLKPCMMATGARGARVDGRSSGLGEAGGDDCCGGKVGGAEGQSWRTATVTS